MLQTLVCPLTSHRLAKAPRKWADFRWLRAAFGGRLVPVELGKLRARGANAGDGGGGGGDSGGGDDSGGGGGWGEKLMRLDEFIDGFLADEAAGGGSAPPRLGYLAQHALFEQAARACGDGGDAGGALQWASLPRARARTL